MTSSPPETSPPPPPSAASLTPLLQAQLSQISGINQPQPARQRAAAAAAAAATQQPTSFQPLSTSPHIHLPAGKDEEDEDPPLFPFSPSDLIPASTKRQIYSRLSHPGSMQFLAPLLTGALFTAMEDHRGVTTLTPTLLKVLMLAVPILFLDFSERKERDNGIMLPLDDEEDATRGKRRGTRGSWDFVAGGAISLPRFRVGNLGLMAVSGFALWTLPKDTWIVGGISVAGTIVYPFTRRWETFSQVFSAALMAWGVLVGASVRKEMPFLECGRWDGICRLRGLDRGTESILWFYLVMLAWSLGCEMIYELRDEGDGALARGELVRMFKRNRMLTVGLLAAVQMVFSVVAGIRSGASFTYYIFSVGTLALPIILKFTDVDATNARSNSRYIHQGSLIAAGSLTAGCLIDYLIYVL